MSRTARALTLAVAALTGGVLTPDALAQKHVDTRFGFEFSPPRDWTQIPPQSNEHWMVAKYRADKDYFYTDPDTGWTARHTPETLVVAFIESVIEGSGETVVEEDEGTKISILQKPYLDYEDFLDRTYTGGGFFIDEKESTEVGGVSVTQYSIKVEKLARTGPKRIMTWVYDGDGVDFAVQTEILEKEVDKVGKEVSRMLKSFKLIEREGELPTSARVNTFFSIEMLDRGTSEERAETRQRSAETTHAQVIAGLPADWDYEQRDSLLLVYHCDKKSAQRIADHTEALYNWFDDTFEYVGKGEYVRPPVLRVCADSDEQRSFSTGRGGGFFSSGIEVVTHKDQGGFIGYAMDNVNSRLLSLWFQDRDRALWWAMPAWLRYGLVEYVQKARAKGRGMEFRMDDLALEFVRDLARNGSGTKPQDLMRMGNETFTAKGDVGSGSGSRALDRIWESGALVRFLLSKDATRDKRTKGLLERYIISLDEVVEEREAERKAKRELEKEEGEEDDEEEEPETEEEEAERLSQRRELWKEREREILDDVWFRALRSLDDSDWERIEKAYFGSF